MYAVIIDSPWNFILNTHSKCNNNTYRHCSQIDIVVSLVRTSYDSNTNTLTDCILCLCFFMTQATTFKCAKTLCWVICILISYYRVSNLKFHLALIFFCVYYCFNEIILLYIPTFHYYLAKAISTRILFPWTPHP